MQWVALTLMVLTLGAAPAARAQEGAGTTENDYYRMETLPIPEGVVLEVGGLAMLPDGRLGVATRRGEVWLIENPTMAGGAPPHFTRFAHGLHEALGLAYHDRALYTAQRSEVTRLVDRDGDDRADRYTSVYSWPLDGNYHEYAYGPVFRDDGTMFVTLNLAWVGHGESLSPWHGWALALTPDGTMTPFAAGMRSPAGFGFFDGELFYAENQGDWIGSGYLTHVERGDFVGNPAGLRWTGLPGSPLSLRPEDVPDTGRPLFEVARSVPGLKPPAVWLPHTLMGISTSGLRVDRTGGAFGPFAGQLFVGDQGHSKINRVFLEKVKGVYQGAAFPFREGFASGVLRLAWGHDGSLFVGMTSRGWPATGPEPYGLQRLVWTGKTPFEVQTMRATPDGFALTFTTAVDPAAAADPASYAVTGFTYHYHAAYGSPPLNQERGEVRYVLISDDGLQARLVVDGLREGYIHELKMPGVRSASGQRLLHDVAYYTLNRIPDGDRLTVAVPGQATPVAPPPAGAPAESVMPASWGGRPDVTFILRPVPGLRYDLPAFDVAPGTRIQLVFNNTDDMLHNVVFTRPGRVAAVAEAAQALGLEGHDRDYVPDTGDVLFHTALLAPGTAGTIYFTAPTEPGAYPYVCTFPGHAATMQGTMRVR